MIPDILKLLHSGEAENPCYEVGSNYPGYDITQGKRDSLSLCTVWCKSTDSCIAVVWREDDLQCWLKHTVSSSETYRELASVRMACLKQGEWLGNRARL